MLRVGFVGNVGDTPINEILKSSVLEGWAKIPIMKIPDWGTSIFLRKTYAKEQV